MNAQARTVSSRSAMRSRQVATSASDVVSLGRMGGKGSIRRMDYDLLIRNATVIDGTRAPRYQADIAVNNGRIAAIGRLDGAQADVELDIGGRIAAPGFIDAHTHDDRLMLSAPDMAPKVSQGVTTVVAGNCGCSLAPAPRGMRAPVTRSEEHTSELQSHSELVCRLLL